MIPDGGFHVVAYPILSRGDRILLARRAGVSYADGLWGLPGGHVEAGESLAAAAAREAREEVGVAIEPADLTPVGICRYADAEMAGLDVFFRARAFTGEPRPVSECDRVTWCALDELPAPVIPWLPAALRHHLVDGVWFNEIVK